MGKPPELGHALFMQSKRYFHQCVHILLLILAMLSLPVPLCLRLIKSFSAPAERIMSRTKYDWGMPTEIHQRSLDFYQDINQDND